MEITDHRLVELADEVAEQAHLGQTDKAGLPYIEHPRRVERHLVRLYPDAPVEARAAALLHDVVEDTEVTLAVLRSLGFPDDVVTAVDAVTKRSGEAKEDYFARIRADRLAPMVKRADLADNTDPARMALLPEDARVRLTAKYAAAAELLGESEE
ncbi:MULTISPECIES: HD domain-containing protein [Arthrobacter]|uniref:HD domain-containing protein n=2 Tax=Arthrobacter TaxID=1663 RepID=A0ABU9KM32_9MICC|nr:HD domain-containing protein [Arthrobacter sp. YJM1]MDP5228121.1 HD domain-containing protein [Arthrobacter sp. YJM1]